MVRQRALINEERLHSSSISAHDTLSVYGEFKPRKNHCQDFGEQGRKVNGPLRITTDVVPSLHILVFFVSYSLRSRRIFRWQWFENTKRAD